MACDVASHNNLDDRHQLSKKLVLAIGVWRHNIHFALIAESVIQPHRVELHCAGRAMSRHQAMKKWQGHQIIQELAQQGILIRSASYRGVAEEAPGAYKNVDEVVDTAQNAGLAQKVAKLVPVVCIKG
jgi:hypothetical protein